MKRLDGLDVARGLACLGMIQAHAFDAYVDPPFRQSAGFALTRFVALLPLPLFLVLAGMGVALRLERDASRAREPLVRHALRQELVKRGLYVAGVGYLLNVLYALMDGVEGVETILRVDVLQVIGLSIMLLGITLPGREHPRRVALILAALLLLPSPWLNQGALKLADGGALAILCSPWVDVPNFTRMPLFPLGVWAAAGFFCMRSLRARPLQFAAGAALVALLAYGGMLTWVAHGASLSRRHPIVYLNALDLAARAMALIGFTVWGTARLRRDHGVLKPLLILGRGSLFVYAFHLPFAYGALGRILRQQELDVATASLCVVTLTGLTYMALRAKNRLLEWKAR